jgi:acyl-CoA thioester hydrolase
MNPDQPALRGSQRLAPQGEGQHENLMLTGTMSKGIHHLSIRVYYEDTDFSGFVYHSNYLKFCERARSDFLRVLGVNQNAMFADGAAFVVRRINCDFLKPAKFDDILTVESSPGEAKGARFEIRQRVFRGGLELFTADVTAVLIDRDGRPKRLTTDLLAALSRITC